jgi:hypothetical protein
MSLLRVVLKPVRISSANFGLILAGKDGTLNVRCTLRMWFCTSYTSFFKTLLSILCYVELWKDMGQYVCSDTHSLLSDAYQGLFPLGVKRPGREADHSPPSSAEVKNAWSYTSTPQYVFMSWYLVEHRYNFTLPLLS